MTQAKQTKKLVMVISISVFLTYASTAFSSNDKNAEKEKDQNNASIELGAPDYISSYDISAKKIMSMEVVNKNENKLGKIQDLLIDKNNEVTYAVISLGGIFIIEDEKNITGKLIAVPFRQFRINETEMEAMLVDIPQKELEQSPEFQYGKEIKYDRNIAKIIGLKIIGKDENVMGIVEDLILSDNKNKITYAILSVGGTLGLGDKLVAAPFNSLEINIAKEKVLLPVTGKQLKQAPEFQFRKPREIEPH